MDLTGNLRGLGGKGYFLLVLVILLVMYAGFAYVYEPEGNRNYCGPDSRLVDACVEIYDPVCGVFFSGRGGCPEDPCAQTFSNDCFACMNRSIEYWLPGECPS
jgi:hypothetical protein